MIRVRNVCVIYNNHGISVQSKPLRRRALALLEPQDSCGSFRKFIFGTVLEEMGGWVSHLWWGGKPDIENPFSGLTLREIHAVQKSWAPVNANAVANGTELLKRFFRAYPQTKEFFRMIRNLPEDEYANNIQFKAHVVNLMSSLTLAIDNLHQPEVVAVMMNKLGESHHRRKIPQQNFHDLKEVIVKMFIEVLNLDGATLSAWSKTVDFWYKHIFESMKNTEETR